MYVVGKYECIAFKHWKLLYNKKTKNKQHLAKVLRKLRRKRIAQAFHEIKISYWNISKKDLLKVRERNWLKSCERE